MMASFRPFTDMWGWKAAAMGWFDVIVKQQKDAKRKARARKKKASRR